MQQDTHVSEVTQEKGLLVRLLIKITIYYVVLFGFVTALVTVAPSVLDHLPVGGVSALSGGADLEIGQLEEAMLNGEVDFDALDTSGSQTSSNEISSRFLFADARFLFISMFGSLLLMLPVSWVYKTIHRHGEHDHSLDETTLILPAVVAGIVMVVQHSLALAFSLAGIVAGVQFRRALSDTFDTLFIFVAIAVGIAAGIKALDIAVVLTVFFNFSAILVCLFGDGLESHHTAEKKRHKAELKAAQLQRDAEELS